VRIATRLHKHAKRQSNNSYESVQCGPRVHLDGLRAREELLHDDLILIILEKKLQTKLEIVGYKDVTVSANRPQAHHLYSWTTEDTQDSQEMSAGGYCIICSCWPLVLGLCALIGLPCTEATIDLSFTNPVADS